MIKAAFRHKNGVNSVISRCILVLSQAQTQGTCSILAPLALSAPFDLRRRSIASGGSIGGGICDDFDARGPSSAAPPTPEQIARVASEAVSDVSAVVNQLNSELESFFGMGLPSGPASSSSSSSSSGFSSSPLPTRKSPHEASPSSSSSSPSPPSSPPPPNCTHLTHVDAATGAASMVDVGLKPETRRTAVARGRVVLGTRAAFAAVEANAVAKGDVLSLARVAGILGAKAVPSLVPLCHTVVLDRVRVSASLDKSKNSVELEAEATATGKTGVEMEALAAVGAAALTVYDMTKAMARGSTIEGIRLVSKRGGKSGDWTRRGGEGEGVEEAEENVVEGKERKRGKKK